MSSPAKGNGATVQGTVSSASASPGTTVGRLVPLEVLTGAVWDGRLLWVSDTEAGLTIFDPSSKEVKRQPALPLALGDGLGLVKTTDGRIAGIGVDAATGRAKLLTVARAGGLYEAKALQGRPLGGGFVSGDSIMVADYQRGIVLVDARTGASQTALRLPFVPNLLAAGPANSFWVVNDQRSRVVRISTGGAIVADVTTAGYISGLAVDKAGSAWIVQGRSLTIVSPSGAQAQSPGAVGNAVIRCGASVVVSDSERGVVTWFQSLRGRNEEVRVGIPGRAVACSDAGVWFLSSAGDASEVARPARA